ncbi:MAG: Nif3-like dinuclear metal center hexameric protein [Thermoflexaceae bacterium]|nr:Nif3-like dinuclear metal center hexameric protein [Thermoflexaceae bacterium]
MKCSEVIEKIEEMCPLNAACEWDNPGLVTGDAQSEIRSIMIALDATDEVIEEAVKQRVDMLLTHHPLIFGKIRKINTDDIIGKRLIKLIHNGINCYAAHTNFDVKAMASLAASMLGLEAPEVLEVTAVRDGVEEGIGRVSDVYESSAMVWIEKLKASFELENVIVYGDTDKIVKRVAISPGSGKGMIEHAVAKKADLLITGDIGHHDGLDAVEAGITVVDAGHYGLEYVFIDYMAKFLERECSDVRIITCKSGVPYKIL